MYVSQLDWRSTPNLLVGDRWQSAPDGIKAHDFSYWTPLSFLPNGIADCPWIHIFFDSRKLNRDGGDYPAIPGHRTDSLLARIIYLSILFVAYFVLF